MNKIVMFILIIIVVLIGVFFFNLLSTPKIKIGFEEFTSEMGSSDWYPRDSVEILKNNEKRLSFKIVHNIDLTNRSYTIKFKSQNPDWMYTTYENHSLIGSAIKTKELSAKGDKYELCMYIVVNETVHTQTELIAEVWFNNTSIKNETLTIFVK